jgi:hypothetical protein
MLRCGFDIFNWEERRTINVDKDASFRAERNTEGVFAMRKISMASCLLTIPARAAAQSLDWRKNTVSVLLSSGEKPSSRPLGIVRLLH